MILRRQFLQTVLGSLFIFPLCKKKSSDNDVVLDEKWLGVNVKLNEHKATIADMTFKNKNIHLVPNIKYRFHRCKFYGCEINSVNIDSRFYDCFFSNSGPSSLNESCPSSSQSLQCALDTVAY